MTLQPYPTLAQATLNTAQPRLAHSLALVLGGALLVALCAQVSIPLHPVPVTLQTLGVLLVGAALGARKGTAALLTYLAAGAAGLPVFAAGGAGLLAASGGLRPSLGYLLGCVLAAGAVGYLCERYGADRTPLGTAAAMLVGNLLIYALGLPLLGAITGLHGASLVAQGLTPFVLGDLLKLLLAAALLPLAWRFVGRKSD